MKTYLGIDPGQSGGIALVNDLGGYEAWKMPATDHDLAMLVRDKGAFTSFTVIEAVHSFPGQGIASAFKFGMNYGGLRMALLASGLPFEGVQPGTWQKMFGLVFPKKMKLTNVQKKNKHKARAQELFPKLKVTHATADALLLAEYCRRTYG